MMAQSIDPESIDLAELAVVLRSACGGTIAGAVVGRTRLRDEVSRHLECSQLEAERIVDTMIGRGFIRRREALGRPMEWLIGEQGLGAEPRH